MPVIVIGGDTPLGSAIIGEIAAPGREVRAFVSDIATAEALRERGIKVALGDISDTSHVEAAATGCFSAVLIRMAATDGRDIAFASNTDEVAGGWAEAISAAGVKRAIWIDATGPRTTPEWRSVDSTGLTVEEVARIVADLDDAASI